MYDALAINKQVMNQRQNGFTAIRAADDSGVAHAAAGRARRMRKRLAC